MITLQDIIDIKEIQVDRMLDNLHTFDIKRLETLTRQIDALRAADEIRGRWGSPAAYEGR